LPRLGSATSGRTHPWRTEHRRKRVGRSCKIEAAHPARLGRCRSANIKPADSRYDRGTSGGQVKANRQAMVSVTLASGEVPVMLGLRLLLPDSWTETDERMIKAGFPKKFRQNKTKPW